MGTTTDDYLLSITLDLKNDKAVGALVRDLNKVKGAVPQATRNLKQASTSMGKFGRQAQNASFQLTDFIVQVQGGQAASRAFAQQAPQLLAGFGALGAALGVVAAVMPSVIAGFSGGSDAAKTLDEQIEKLTKDTQDLADTVDRVDFSGWIKSFNKMDQQARTLTASIINLKLQALEIDFQEAVESFSGFVDVIVPGTRLADIQLQSMADSLGVSVGTLEQLMPLVREFREDPFANPQNLERMVQLMEEAGVSALPLLKRLEALKGLQESLQAGRETQAKAGAAGAGGTIATGEERLENIIPFAGAGGEKAIKNTEIYRESLRRLGEQVRQFEEDIATVSDTTNNVLVDNFDAATAAADIFADSFETAFDGVAMGTQSVSDAFENMAKVIIAQLLKIAAQMAITQLFGGNFLGGAFNPASAKGNAFNNGNVIPMARGGIVNGPTIFPMAKGVGLMGEAGPEAVLPLARTSSGNLGVESTGMNVTINNLAPGVSVKPRQDAGGLTLDVVMESVSGAIRRGGNDVANALEESYSIGRGRAVY